MPPVQINPALQVRVRPGLQARPVGSLPAVDRPGELSISPESQQLLQEFEEATGVDQNWDPCSAEANMSGAWLSGKGCGYKRKQPVLRRTSVVKAPRRSSSPLLCVDEQKELGSLKGDFDWDALLDSELCGELSLDSTCQLSPMERDEDLTVRGRHIGRPQQWSSLEASADSTGSYILSETQQSSLDFDEETFLATAFLQSPWPEEDEGGQGKRADFLCNSGVNFDQLLNLGDSFSGDLSSKIESFL